MPEFTFQSPGINIREIDNSAMPAVPDELGPIIIGRTLKGPAMEPVKITSWDSYVKVFGKPTAGGLSATGDVWRDGPNMSAPTYASYAAQAWLASGNSPVTIVRLLGDQVDTPSSNGFAGWQVSGASGCVPSASAAHNSTAYGLFVIDKAACIADSGASSKVGITTSTLSNYEGQTITVGTTIFEFDYSSNGAATTDAIAVDISSAGSEEGVVLALIAAIQVKIDDGTLNVDVEVDGGNAKVMVIRNLGASTVALASSSGLHCGLEDASAPGTYDQISVTLAAITGGKYGSLGAILYCDSGYMTLSGTVPDGNSNKSSSACTFIESIGDSLMFGIDVYDTASAKIGSTLKFNFSKSSSKYIRNVLNTNPQKVNTTMTPSADQATYWLGETFERSLKQFVTSSTSGNQYAVLLPLHKADGDANKANWGYQRKEHTKAKTGWVISHDEGNEPTDYNIETYAANPLFRFHCLHGGDDLQKEIMVGIEDIKLAPNANVNAYPSFSVTVRDVAGNLLEKFTNCNLNNNSSNYIEDRIGNFRISSWSESLKKYIYIGDIENRSSYIWVEMKKSDGGYQPNDLPFGFTGPGRPKGFDISEGVSSARALGTGASFAGVFVKGSGSVPASGHSGINDFAGGLPSNATAMFKFPSLILRNSGSDGNPANPYKALYGIRPKDSTTSRVHDNDYVDYLRALPSEFDSSTHEPSGDFEYSFIFSLDNIKIDTANNVITYVSGSRKGNTSYTALSGGTSALLTKKVKQFIMPMFGGRHGLDITQAEPFRNPLIGDLGASESTNYLRHTLLKAVETVKDPEVVPANLILAPGIQDATITDRIISLADDRQDMLAIVDLVGDYLSEYESEDDAATRQGSVATVVDHAENTRMFNSTFACTFYPAVQAIDRMNNNNRVWLPSSIAGLGGMAQSEALSAAWFAPAGFNRGGLGALGGPTGPMVTQARMRLDSDERDELYEMHINPIATFPNEGVVIFGQKTLQSPGINSALSRINVRRLLLFLKEKISHVAKNILFDQNVDSTWARFISEATPILDDVKARFGLTDFKLVLDTTTTTAAMIDQNILYAQVYLKPARAIEYIAIDFMVTRTGASFA